MMRLTKAQARRFLLHYQGLQPHTNSQPLHGKKGVLEYLRKVRCIQVDPLDRVGMNHELVLNARVQGFSPELLWELLYQDRSLLEGLDKMLSIYPVEDWPFFARFRQRSREHESKSPRGKKVAPAYPQVLEQIEKRGPLCSGDIQLNQKVDWYWAPTTLARAALESLFFRGELGIHHRQKKRKYYELLQKLLPPEVFSRKDPNHQDSDYHDWHTLRRIRSVGLLWNRASDIWAGLFKTPERNAALSRLEKEAENASRERILRVQVQDIPAPFFLAHSQLPLLEKCMAPCDPEPPQVRFLAPLDNLLWDRKMVEALFGFSYNWEVYKPASQRTYGYYVLPVLYGDRFVARFEPVRDRNTKCLRILGWWWEDNVKPDTALRTQMKQALQRFCTYLQVPHFEFERNNTL